MQGIKCLEQFWSGITYSVLKNKLKQIQRINYTQYFLYTDTELPNCNYRAYIF